ncbi:hypothetical protein JCM14469_30580 [Desulfatiferula olefinivorans]
MDQSKPLYYNDVTACVDEMIRRVGKTIVFGMPLALGKSHPVINELYRRAKQDPSVNLTIITALALEKPGWKSDLERRMMEPLVGRIWNGIPDFDYMVDLRRNALPANVSVREFFCKAGSFVNVPRAQQEYVSSNYTHVVRDLIRNGINVYCHQVAKREEGGQVFYSDSCNADIGELTDYMMEQSRAGKPAVHIGHVNRNLPFMYGDAVTGPERFHMILEDEAYHLPLFSVPRASVSVQDHMIGMHVSSLVKDGGTLQIGIGTLGDAIANALILRHSRPAVYRRFLSSSGIDEKFGSVIDQVGGRDAFDQGLYGATEMLVEVFINLYKAGIIKRRVYDDASIQKLINEGGLDETLTPEAVDILLQQKPYSPVLTEDGFRTLKRFGIFREDLDYRDYRIVNGKASWSADFRDEENRRKVAEQCRGDRLKNGVLIHGGFFIGSKGFYEELRAMNEDERRQFEMTGVAKVNQLYGDERLRALQRKNARFVNAGMILSILGNVCSDGLENGTVISGVGGQYNFVSMAHALPDARLIMMIRSTRQKGAKTLSNIVFNYGHTTVPRHLRDIVVTEYGIADLLGKSDREVIAAILNVTDSRFQEDLLAQAKKAGKIPESYQIPEQFRHNTPERLASMMGPFKADNCFKPFPFGTDLTDQELVIGKALKQFKASLTRSRFSTLGGLMKSMVRKPSPTALPYLERLDLHVPTSLSEKMMRQVVVFALDSSGAL